MKITVSKDALSAELSKLQGIVGSKSTMPILQNALIEADPELGLVLQATDLDVSLRCRVLPEDVRVDQPGRIAVRAKDLHDAVKNLKSLEVTLEREDQNWIRLTAGSVRARFVGMNPDEFPQISLGEDPAFTQLPTDRFVRLIDLTQFSISTDSARPHLGGAFLHRTEQGNVGMVSTDGHRLSTASFDVAPGTELPDALKDGVIVPRKGLNELRKAMDLTHPELSVAIQNSTIIFEQSATRLSVRLIEGNYPSWRQVIPEEHEDRKAVIARDTLADRVRFVSMFSSNRTRNIRLSLEDGTCTIAAQDPDKGECEEALPVAYSGPPVRAGFNYQYILDVLSVVRSSEVSIEITDTLRPAVMHELEPREGESSLFIVMPMRI